MIFQHEQEISSDWVEPLLFPVWEPGTPMPKNLDLQELKIRIPQGGVTVRGTTATSTPWFLSLYVRAFADTALC